MSSRPLLVQPAPFLRRPLTTPVLMRDVLLALVPVLGAAVWYFGASALLVVGAAVAGACGTEWALGPGGRRGTSLADGSAILTGVLLGLTLPPGLPLWMAFVGGVVAIGLGKAVWGGLGHNLFNPALVGRAFLQAAFPTALTTWTTPGGASLWLRGSNLALPFLRSDVDAVSVATPLALAKFQGESTPFASLLAGSTSGSLGETSAALLILCGLVLGLRRSFDWRIPVALLAAVAVFAGVLHWVDPGRYPAPVFHLLSGGLLFGTVFMATDPVTSPVAPKAAWVFGAGVGLLVVLIRTFGGLPEGVMYSILLMNAASPLIEKQMQPRVFGRKAVS